LARLHLSAGGPNQDPATGKYRYIDLVSDSNGLIAKAGVTCSVERAAVDAAGNAGTYAAVTLSASPSTATALPTGALTADVLGNLPVTAISTVYDRGLPAAGGKYKYRIKAVKGSVTQAKEISTTVTADPRSYATGYISIGTPSGTGTDPGTYGRFADGRQASRLSRLKNRIIPKKKNHGVHGVTRRKTVFVTKTPCFSVPSVVFLSSCNCSYQCV
jgi:hypothetical protein